MATSAARCPFADLVKPIAISPSLKLDDVYEKLKAPFRFEVFNLTNTPLSIT
jgi:hypothetical protein